MCRAKELEMVGLDEPKLRVLLFFFFVHTCDLFKLALIKIWNRFFTRIKFYVAIFLPIS